VRSSPLPDNVVRFIRDHIDRLETLDVLVILSGGPSKGWSARELSVHMRSSLLAAETALERLVGSGLVAREGDAHIFRPGTKDLEEQVREVLTCYREKRTAIITEIFARPSRAIQTFADAFRIKKDK
jgi:hypothetical protein